MPIKKKNKNNWLYSTIFPKIHEKNNRIEDIEALKKKSSNPISHLVVHCTGNLTYNQHREEVEGMKPLKASVFSFPLYSKFKDSTLNWHYLPI